MFSNLRRWLLDRRHELKIRFRSYRQCVFPTILYDIFEMDLIHQGCTSIIGTINAHHRSMAPASVHLIYMSTKDFFQSLGLDPPWIKLYPHYIRLVDALNHRRNHLLGVTMPLRLKISIFGTQNILRVISHFPSPKPIHILRSLHSSALNAIEHLHKLVRTIVIFVSNIRFHAFLIIFIIHFETYECTQFVDIA